MTRRMFLSSPIAVFGSGASSRSTDDLLAHVPPDIGYTQIALDAIRECTHCWRPFGASVERKLVLWPNVLCVDCFRQRANWMQRMADVIEGKRC